MLKTPENPALTTLLSLLRAHDLAPTMSEATNTLAAADLSRPTSELLRVFACAIARQANRNLTFRTPFGRRRPGFEHASSTVVTHDDLSAANALLDRVAASERVEDLSAFHTAAGQPKCVVFVAPLAIATAPSATSGLEAVIRLVTSLQMDGTDLLIAALDATSAKASA